MIAPAAAFIEMAKDRLKDDSYVKQHAKILAAQSYEIHSAFPGRSSEFYEAFNIGIETARILLEGMMSAVSNNVTL